MIRVLFCFIKLILGSRYGPGVSSRASPEGTRPRLRIDDVPLRPVPHQRTCNDVKHNKKLRVQIQNCRDVLVAIEKPETAKDDARKIEVRRGHEF